MNDINYAPVCGLYCGTCNFLGKECTGCGYLEGKPFWTNSIRIEVCPLHDCCRNQKQLEHCGLCEDFPCNTFLELRDTSMTDEEFKASLDSRKNELKKRTEIGTEIWLKDKSTV